MKQISYLAARADGRMERFRCPTLFGAYDVAERLRHSLVFTTVAEGASCYGDGLNGRIKITGPAVVVIDAERKQFVEVPEMPVNQAHAYALWSTYAGPARQAAAARARKAMVAV